MSQEVRDEIVSILNEEGPRTIQELYGGVQANNPDIDRQLLLLLNQGSVVCEYRLSNLVDPPKDDTAARYEVAMKREMALDMAIRAYKQSTIVNQSVAEGELLALAQKFYGFLTHGDQDAPSKTVENKTRRARQHSGGMIRIDAGKEPSDPVDDLDDEKSMTQAGPPYLYGHRQTARNVE